MNHFVSNTQFFILNIMNFFFFLKLLKQQYSTTTIFLMMVVNNKYHLNLKVKQQYNNNILNGANNK